MSGTEPQGIVIDGLGEIVFLRCRFEPTSDETAEEEK